MKYSILQRIIGGLRDVTPLSLRIKVGPAIAYFAYIVRIYILKNPRAPNVLSPQETLDLIIKNRLSLIRFGDGEISLIENIGLAFQKKDADLATKLKIILRLNTGGLLICIPGIFGKLGHFSKKSFRFTLHHLFKHMHQWNALLSPGRTYGDAFITRPYLTYADAHRLKSGDLFKKLFSIWEGADVALIEGSKSRSGVGNNMFSGAKSVRRLLCPPENAYSKYDEIKMAALKIGKDRLILLSLGPAAKVLAYDLFLLGYRVIDIGHIDMEYEMLLRKEPTLTKVKYKYFNEINERDPEDCRDEQYLSQIIAEIK